MKRKFKIRPCIMAGIQYPKDKENLEKMISSSFTENMTKVTKSPLAIITPYGNYKLALKAYANSYSQIKGEKYDTAIIISPIHKIAYHGIALTESENFSCPLGDLSVDKEANSFMAKYNKESIFYGEKYHRQEHSIEMQLPYLVHLFKNKINILPIIIGESNTKYTILLANAIKKMIDKFDKKFILIIPTILSSNVKYDEAVDTDGRFVSFLFQFNPDHLSEELAMSQIKASGGGGIVTLLRLAQLLNRTSLNILQLYNSGDATGEKLKVEGYISAVIY